ncbi:MAG: NADH-quinone oxidoreductase subunit NuoK [Planctomycetota bacterium]
MSLLATEVLALLMLATGASGFLMRRNAIVLFMSLQSMMCGACLLFAAYARLHRDASGEVAILFVIAMALVQSSVGLGLAIANFRSKRRLDVDGTEEVSP